MSNILTNIALSSSLPLGFSIGYFYNAVVRFRNLKEACSDNVTIFFQNKLKNQIDEKRKKLGFKNEVPLKIVETNMLAQAYGLSPFPSTQGIKISPTALYKDTGFIIAHELSHIKNNDLLTLPTAAIAAHLISSISLTLLLPKSPISKYANLIGSQMIATIAFIATSRYRESKADQLGLTVCNKKEKTEALNLFKKVLKNNLKERNHKDNNILERLIFSLVYSETGENRLDVLHPSLASRINMIEASIQEEEASS